MGHHSEQSVRHDARDCLGQQILWSDGQEDDTSRLDHATDDLAIRLELDFERTEQAAIKQRAEKRKVSVNGLREEKDE